MKVPVQLTYSHGYFVRFLYTGADVIAHLLFVFGFQSWKQFYHEHHKIKSKENCTDYISMVPEGFLHHTTAGINIYIFKRVKGYIWEHIRVKSALHKIELFANFCKTI